MKKKRDWTYWVLWAAYIGGLLLLVIFSSCNSPQRPDWVKDGKEYKIVDECVKYHWESDYGYHYGYNFLSSKYEWHWGTENKQVCDSSVSDTIEINLKEKYYANNRESR